MTTVAAFKELRRGAIEVIPLAAGAGIYGLAFGLLAKQSGMTELQVGIMGSVVFAGAAQIIAVERLASGAGVIVAIIAGIALNLRLLLMTASIRDVFAQRPWWQVTMGAHLTTDENWALMLSTRARGRDVGFPYLIGAGLTVITTWVGSTVAGAYFITMIPEPHAIGMDFAFVAAFIAISRSLWRGKRDIFPWFTSMLVVVISIKLAKLDPSWALIIGGLSGAIIASTQKHG